MNLNLVRRFFKFTVPSIVSMWIFSLYSLLDGLSLIHISEPTRPY